MTKPTWTFYTTFKNVPYTDKEWEREKKWRAERARREGKFDWSQTLNHRPCHSFKYGPTVHSHKQARKVCEEALKNGAQAVQYSAYDRYNLVETWYCRKNKLEWYKIK